MDKSKSLFQWHAENGHENILFMDEKNFTIEDLVALVSATRFMLKCPLRCILKVQGGHHPSYVMVWWEVSHQGVKHFQFCMKGVKLVSECIKRQCCKEL
jgi:predicted lipoprotein